MWQLFLMVSFVLFLLSFCSVVSLLSSIPLVPLLGKLREFVFLLLGRLFSELLIGSMVADILSCEAITWWV